MPLDTIQQWRLRCHLPDLCASCLVAVPTFSMPSSYMSTSSLSDTRSAPFGPMGGKLDKRAQQFYGAGAPNVYEFHGPPLKGRMSSLTRLGIVAATLALLLTSAVPGPNRLSAASQALDVNYATIHKGLTSMTWDGKEFIASYGIHGVPLINVSLDGQSVTPFAPSFVGKDECYAAVSQGKGGFPQGFLYVNNETSIIKIDPAGKNVGVFSSPPGAMRTSYVAFDTVGTWGYVLFALDDNGLLWSIKSDGTAKVLANFSGFANAQSSKVGGLKAEGIAVAPQSFGAYGGYLLITLEGAGTVLAIPPNDTSKVTTIAQLAGEEPERVLQIPPSNDLYVAEFDTGARVRVPAANFSNYVGSMLVITEGENEPFGSLTVLQATGSGVTATRIGTVTGSPHFEGASFVPASALPAGATSTTLHLPPATQSTTQSTAASISTTTAAGVSDITLLGGAALLVVVIAVAAFLILKRGRSPR